MTTGFASSTNIPLVITTSVLLLIAPLCHAQWSDYTTILTRSGTTSSKLRGSLKVGQGTMVYKNGIDVVIFRNILNSWQEIQTITAASINVSSITVADTSGDTVILGVTEYSAGAGGILVYKESAPGSTFNLSQVITGTVSSGNLGSDVILDKNQVLVLATDIASGFKKSLFLYTRPDSASDFGMNPLTIDTTQMTAALSWIHIHQDTIYFTENWPKGHIYTRSANGTFVHFQEFLPRAGSTSFGYGASFHGNTMVACAHWQNICDVWERTSFGNVFVFKQELPPSNLWGSYYGIAVSVQGNLIVAGARNTGVQGQAFFWLRNASNVWVEQQFTKGGFKDHYGVRMDIDYPNVVIGEEIPNGKIYLYKTTAAQSVINPLGPTTSPTTGTPTTTPSTMSPTRTPTTSSPTGTPTTSAPSTAVPSASPTTTAPTTSGPTAAPASAALVAVAATFATVSGLPASWGSGDPCSGWVGVQCSPSGQIESISLAGAGVAGEMDMTVLPRTANMDLSGNPQLGGNLSISSVPVIMLVLNIVNTNVSGVINPAEIRQNFTIISNTDLLCLCPDGTLVGPRTSTTCTGPVGCAATCPCKGPDARRQVLGQFSTAGFYVLVTVTGTYLLVALAGLIDSLTKGQENYKFWVFAAAGLSSIDMYSDVAFVFAMLAAGRPLLAMASLVFIALPVLANIVGTVLLITNWKKTKAISDHLHRWMERNGFFLATFFVMTGSTYGAISLANTCLFGWTAFSMGIPRRYREGVTFSHMLTTVGMENIPQMIIQVVFILSPGNFRSLTVLFSLITTLIVILRTMLKFLFQWTNRSVGHEFEDWVEFHVESEELRGMFSDLRIKTHKLRSAVGIALEKDTGDIEVLPVVRVGDEAFRLTASVRTVVSEDIAPLVDKALLPGCVLARSLAKKFELHAAPLITKAEHLGRLNQAAEFACGLCRHRVREERRTLGGGEALQAERGIRISRVATDEPGSPKSRDQLWDGNEVFADNGNVHQRSDSEVFGPGPVRPTEGQPTEGYGQEGYEGQEGDGQTGGPPPVPEQNNLDWVIANAATSGNA